MKRTLLLLALLTTFGANLAACSDDDSDEPKEHGEHEHEDGGTDR